MPFGNVHTPSLALSLLQAELAQASVSSRVVYLNLDFAEQIGLERYERYATDLSGAFLGERIFADCLFPRPEREAERYVEDVLIPLQRFSLDDIAAFEQDLAAASPFLEQCLRSRDWGRHRAIGFTTTFQQNTASLAFARMLKQAHPQVAILFGGANCEGTMGAQLLKTFPWIDYVCTGEGDDVVPELALELVGRRPPGPIAGILRRSEGPELALLTHPPTVTGLDRLPFPEVSDYFERVRESPARAEIRCHVTLETSRGCWWGEKHHCTFCGLNGLTMRFRSKSPERAQREIIELAGRYKPMLDAGRGISFADNILDMSYFRSVLPALREAGLGTTLFYETKANLTRDQVRLLADSGIREIQPGIESLHTDLLKLMRKGCTSLQNIQLLKWCRGFGITPHWNLLFGFPGEDPRWFAEQARIIPRIRHLNPPGILGPVRLDRFSPYFSEAEAHGIINIRPARALSHIYPLPDTVLHGLAYHFDFDFADGRDPIRYMDALRQAVREWRRVEEDAFFYALPWNDDLLLWDQREPGAGGARRLNPAMRRLYEFCDRVRSAQEIRGFAGETLGMAEAEVSGTLAEWTRDHLVIAEDDRFLALAVLVVDEAGPRSLELGATDRARGPAIPSSARPLRRADARSLTLPEGTLVIDRAGGRAVVLSGLAADLWAEADGERSVAAIGAEESRGRPDRELQRTLAALVAEGLVRLV
jgi:ribosomal peptide maturation radical SAM protein 1